VTLRIGFICSTVLDLKDLRNFLSFELKAHGFKMLLSEEGNIPADSSKHSYQLCIDAAKECDFLVAIIDGRFGGEVPGTGQSITLAEIAAALEAGKQVRVFVRQSVWDAKETLRPYVDDKVAFRSSKIVQDERVFDVIDAVRKQVTGNWIFTFNRAEEILSILSEQFGFALKVPDDPAIDKLDRILARKAIRAFNQPLMDRFIEGIQVQSIYITDAEDFEDAVEMFLPHTMRFAGKESSVAFNQLIENAANLNHETPLLFGPSQVSGKYTSRLPLPYELDPSYHERLRKLNELALATYRSWAKCIALVRAKWPDLILELHEDSE
jgi:hypothetical protein